MRSLTVLFVAYLLLITAAQTQSDCSLSVPAELEKNSPVYIQNNTRRYQLITPQEGYINLKFGEKIILACPDPKNYLVSLNSNFSEVSCLEANTVKISRRHYSFEELLCKKTVRGEAFNTHVKCGRSGHLVDIGYRISRNNWITLIEVCYDNQTGNTLYTQHMLHGESIKYASKSTHRPEFSSSALGNDIPASVVYKRTFQKSTFGKLLGSSKLAESYINDGSYLARGHLSPDADFLIASTQHTSYFYLNVCPQWQSINGGNWKSLEFIVRKTAEKYQDRFRIISGTYDILTLTDVENNDVEIYLAPRRKIPVPKYIWKMVFDEEQNKGIVLIILNNPFVNEISQKDFLCDSICDEYGWGTDAWKLPMKGFIHCCSTQDFSSIVSFAPKLRTKSVLFGLGIII